MWLQMRKSKYRWIQSYKVVFTICRYVALSQDWVGDSLNLYSRQNFGGETRVCDDVDHIAGIGDGGGHSARIGDG